MSDWLHQTQQEVLFSCPSPLHHFPVSNSCWLLPWFMTLVGEPGHTWLLRVTPHMRPSLPERDAPSSHISVWISEHLD